MIHAYASRQHYYDHLQPIFDALPAGLRGVVMSPKSTDRWRTGPMEKPGPGDLVMVAAHVDSQKFARSGVIYVEHGAGQTYEGDPRAAGHGSYSGGEGHDNAVLFLSPSERVAQRWRDRYDAPAIAVGCPKLDKYHGMIDLTEREPTVVFTFHWENPLCPESMSALPHFQNYLQAVVDDLRLVRGYRVIGHSHPRAQQRLWRLWKQLDVPILPGLGPVLGGQATVLVADNTSAMYEAAAVGIPVVALNAPWYRRDVEHGLRFWDAVPGLQVDNAEVLADAVDLSAAGEGERLREAAVAYAYAHVDGKATERAVAAILEVAGA